VDIEKCIGCGACSRVCPTQAPSEHDEKLGFRKAAYIPFPQSVPSVYTIDFEHCIRCGACAKICPRKCIDINDQGSIKELKVGAIVISTGFELFDLSGLTQYGYGKYPNVITSLEMERILDVNGPTSSQLIVPKTKKEVKSVTFVLCAGSRDTEVGRPHCSRVCCLYSMKQAQLLRDRGVDVWIHYIDIRAPGRRYEEFYKTTQDKGANFVKGKVAELVPQGDQMLVRSEDMMLNRMLEYTVDLVVLAPPIVTSDETLKLAEMLRVPVDEDKFVLERHPKLDPMATKRDGIFAAGTIVGPKDIQTTTAEAEGAAMKVVNFLHGDRVIEPNKAFLLHPDNCDGCSKCAEICPETAISIKDSKPVINGIMCSGCGVCIPTCPKNALDQQGLSEAQLKSQIRGVLENSGAGLKILAFVEKEVAYTAVDLAGLARLPYPSSIRIIPLPSLARLKLEHLLLAFAHGADGVMLLEAPVHEGPFGRAHLLAEERADEYRWALEDHGIDSSRIWFSRVYVPDWRKLERVFGTFHNIIEGEGPINEDTRIKLRGELT
jgi:heterodisulfide reductase subunit A